MQLLFWISRAAFFSNCYPKYITMKNNDGAFQTLCTRKATMKPVQPHEAFVYLLLHNRLFRLSNCPEKG